MISPWFPQVIEREQARLRLFCLAFAGGSWTYFRSWPALAPDWLELWPVELPGRGTRLREPLVDDMDTLGEALAGQIAARADLPFAFFGHSMGSAVAHATTRALARRGLSPVLVAASGRAAPHRAFPRALHRQPAERLKAEMVRLDGTAREILENDELMDFVIPIMRNDFRLIETYSPEPEPLLHAPVMVLCGEDDVDVTKEQLDAWAELTTGSFELHLFPGGHFYLNDHVRPVLDLVARRLAGLLDPQPAA